MVYGYEIDYFNVMFADAVSEGNVEYVSNPVRYYSGSSLLSWDCKSSVNMVA